MLADEKEVNKEDLVLIGTFAIRGINYQNDDGMWRIDNYRRLEKGSFVYLVMDGNEYDPNSILITSDEGDLGYIPKNMTNKIRQHSDKYLVAMIDGGQRIRVWYEKSKKPTRIDSIGIGQENMNSKKGQSIWKVFIYSIAVISLIGVIAYSISGPSKKVESKEIKGNSNLSYSHEMIGNWDVEVPMLDRKYTLELYHKTGEYLMYSTLSDRVEDLNKMNEIYFVKDSGHDEYYRILESGDLEIGDIDGVIKMYETKIVRSDNNR